MNYYMPHGLTIVHIASECSPYAKTGGLGDVVSALPKALDKLGNNVAVFLPLYGSVKKQNLPLQNVYSQTILVGGKKLPASLKTLDTGNGVKIFFIANEQLFGKKNGIYGYPDDGLRFQFFNVAVLTFLEKLSAEKRAPFESGKIDLLHCHDWHSGLIPQLIALGKFKSLANVPTAFTIHNLAFQGPNAWWCVPDRKKDDGKGDPSAKGLNPKYLNFARRAILKADVINAVSERYAAEILTPKFGQGLDRLLRARQDRVYGIINGVDYAVFNPEFDQNIFEQYNAAKIEKKLENKVRLQTEAGLEVNRRLPLMGMANRLTEQKGFELMIQIIPSLLKLPVQLIIAGDGDRYYAKFFRQMARLHPDKIAFYSPFSEEIASKIYAASDMYLMPSRFEPCGISQLISLRYGSVPIVHATGGLHDTVTNYEPLSGKGNGFTFSSYSKEDLLVAIVRAMENYNYYDSWKTLAGGGMKESFSWDLPAKKYMQLYSVAMKKNQTGETFKLQSLQKTLRQISLQIQK